MKISNAMRAIPTDMLMPRRILAEELRRWDAEADFEGVASYAGTEFVGY